MYDEVFLDNVLGRNFSIIQLLLNWSADSEEQKKAIIKKFMNSADVMSVWLMDIAHGHDRINLYNEWIRESPDVVKLKNHLLLREKDKAPERYAFVERLFEKIEKGENVDRDDIFVYPSEPNKDGERSGYLFM